MHLLPLAVLQLLRYIKALVSALKVSAGQAAGVPPFEPVYPAFAKHAVAAVEPVAPPGAELAGQSVQDASEGSAR